MAAGGVLKCKQSDKLTSLLLHRWEAEDVGVWCSSWSLCAPHIHSVYDIPSLVSWWVYFPLFIIILIHEIKPSFFYPPHPLWVKAPLLHCRPAALTSPFLFISFLLPPCHPLVRAAATVPRCIALLKPKSLKPMGRRSGWAKMHMRWFTPVPIAKSWLKAAANEDVESSTCPPSHPTPNTPV